MTLLTRGLEPADNDGVVNADWREICQVQILKEDYKHFLKVYDREHLLTAVKPSRPDYSYSSQWVKLKAEAGKLYKLLKTLEEVLEDERKG